MVDRNRSGLRITLADQTRSTAIASHDGKTMGAPPVRPGELARVIATVRTLHMAAPVLLSPPHHTGEPWTAASDASDRPLRGEAEIDGASGRLVGRLDFADRHWIDRVIGYGIAVHEGALFGIANQIVGTLTALLLVTLCVSGAVLWWRRRPAGVIGAPPRLARPRFHPGLIGVIVALGQWMPLFGLTMLLVLASERTWLGLRAR